MGCAALKISQYELSFSTGGGRYEELACVGVLGFSVYIVYDLKRIVEAEMSVQDFRVEMF